MKLADEEKQRAWLNQHIPHRLRAGLAQTTALDEMLELQVSDPIERLRKAQFCLEMAAWEGRFAATRWLIEFVGVKLDKNGKPARVRDEKNRKREHDVDILDLPGGEYFPLGSDEAVLLAEVWKGCSQATSHATDGSEHPSISRDRIAKAVLAVVHHLEATVYKQAGRSVQI
jgi:hypothetical protein